MNNKIEYSILELAVVSDGVSFQQTLKNSVELALIAERHDYKRLWLAEHHNMPGIASSATSVIIGLIAENTSSIRVGSGGIMLPNHSPLIIAEQFGTLAQLYPGRIDLGLGRASGTDAETARAIRSDYLQAAHSFSNEIAKIEKYFSTHNRESPVRVPIAEGVQVPFYILGSSTDSAFLAAEKGLPYAFASHFASTHLYNALNIYKSNFRPSKALEKPYTIAGINVIIGETNDAAERNFTSLIRMFYNGLVGNRMPLQPPVDFDEHLQELFQHPTIYQMLRFSFVGTREKVKGQIRQFLSETNADELITVSTMFDFEDRVKSSIAFAEIMQELNEEMAADVQ
jgi:luciferase family oxidoreductase group 1